MEAQVIESQLVVATLIQEVLTKLYYQTCTCRRFYEELEDIVDPEFHLDDCEYLLHLEKIGFKY